MNGWPFDRLRANEGLKRWRKRKDPVLSPAALEDLGRASIELGSDRACLDRVMAPFKLVQ